MRGLILSLGFALIAGIAAASDQPLYEPPAAWVKPLEIPKDQAPDTTTPTRTLLLDLQTRLGPDSVDSYTEHAVKIQTPQGLSAVGNLALNWRPDIDTLIIHKARIIRGSETIDLLAGGHSFTVLRRENNLEMAMLDGALTAAMQPEGLRVGDILDLAVTTRRSDPVLEGRSETLAGPLLFTPADYLRVREIWPKSTPMRWRQTDGLPAPTTLATADGEERIIEMSQVQALKAPKGAPPRYFELGEIEGTEFQTWADVSALVAPLFEKASALGPDSPLRAEAAKIKAASDDPKSQAMAALRLVEDEIRYFFLGMNNGGYVPADADQTWTRRFGDCKGKTALLIALLHELGIEAEPALASVGHGDGLDERLPMLGIFDHVLVRATIAGKVYWLDGTRTGDRNLDDLPTPMLHWVLPVRDKGATLVALSAPPPDKPLIALELAVDATGGIDSPAPAHATTIFRADPAIAVKLQLARAPQGDQETYLRQYWKRQYDWIDVKTVDAVYDASTGEERLSMDGSAKLDWKDSSDRFGRHYESRAARLGWKADYDREPGPNSDAPYAVPYPFYTQASESIRLPDGGAGFAVEGRNVDRTIAGMLLKRTARLADGVFTLETSTMALAPEFPASEAQAATKELRDLWDETVYLRAPKSSADDAASKEPVDAAGFLVRGASRQKDGNVDGALADYSRAIQLKPDLAQAYAARALIYLGKKDVSSAKGDVQRANQIDPDAVATRVANAYLLTTEGSFHEALDGLNLAIAAKPDQAPLYEARGAVHEELREWDKALADFDTALRLAPDEPGPHERKAEIHLRRQDGAAALQEADKYLAARPDDPLGHIVRGRALLALDRKTEAVQELSAAIDARPTGDAYFWRAVAHRATDREKALADIAESLRLEPDQLRAYALRADIDLAKGDDESAVAALDEAVRLQPTNMAIVAKRLAALEDNHQYDRAVGDAGLLIASEPLSPTLLLRRCRDRALAGMPPRDALEDCAAALELDQSDVEALEGRALALVLLGRFDEAIADYDAVLKQNPDRAVAHFGRGVARLRKGETGDGQADIAAARAADANIDAEFAGMARPPEWYGVTEADLGAPDPAAAAIAARIQRGQRLIGLGDFDLAIGEFDQAIAQDPTSARAFAMRGAAYFDLHDFDRANADFDAALQRDPRQTDAIEGRGQIAARKGDIAAAIAAFTRVLEIKPDDAKARNARAALFAKNREYDLALNDTNTLIDKAPRDPMLLNNRCWFRAIAGQDLPEALADCDASLKIKQIPSALDSRGFVYLRLGRFDDSIGDYDAALKLRPRQAESLFGRGIARLRKGSTDDGMADLAAARAIDPKIDATFADYGVNP